MNTKQMIEVMQAYANGEKIEEMDRFAVGGWRPFQGTWNWAHLMFRIAPKPEPKKEGRWERAEIRVDDDDYVLSSKRNGWWRVADLQNILGFGGIDYQSPFDPKIIVRSMGPMMFEKGKGGQIYWGYSDKARPGIPVAAWFWREE